MNHQAIYNTHPTVVSIDDGKGAFDVDGNPVTLDQSLVDTETARLQAEQDATKYQRDRAAEYPEIGDQLDMLWHAIDTGDWTDAKVKTTEFYTALKAVKDANPK
jgi:hypothetical protein